MVNITIEELESSKRISGPYPLFNKSFICEFLEPPTQLDATVLIRGTYVSPLINPLGKQGKKHPQSPPLHIHFDQSESFLVAKGKICTTDTYEIKDHVWTREDGVQEVKPWIPHTFWPYPDAEEDSVFYLWAHPDGVPDPMDWLFFENLLRHIGDAYDQNKMPSLVQVMVTQHASASALVLFPTAWWLGPLRWWVPWKLQGAIATVGGWFGYRPLTKEYTPKEEWEKYLHAKRT